MLLGERLYSLRKTLGLSQEKIAEELGVTRQSVSLWETGQSVPSIDNLILLSKIFQVSLDQLVGIVQLKNESNTSSTVIYQVKYTETKESIVMSNQYFDTGWRYIYFITLLILGVNSFNAALQNESIVRILFSIVLLIGLCVILVTIPLMIKKQIIKILNQKNIVNLFFYPEYMHLEKKGMGVDSSYDINYNDVVRMVEKERYFLLYLKRNRAIYVPKQENCEALSLFLSKQISKIIIRTHAYYFSKAFHYSAYCFIMPLFSIVSVGFSIALLKNSDDLPLWFIFIVFPIASFMSGLFGRKFVAKPLWIFSLIIGILTILFELMGLIAIMNA